MLDSLREERHGIRVPRESYREEKKKISTPTVSGGSRRRRRVSLLFQQMVLRLIHLRRNVRGPWTTEEEEEAFPRCTYTLRTAIARDERTPRQHDRLHQNTTNSGVYVEGHVNLTRTSRYACLDMFARRCTKLYEVLAVVRLPTLDRPAHTLHDRACGRFLGWDDISQEREREARQSGTNGSRDSTAENFAVRI